MLVNDEFGVDGWRRSRSRETNVRSGTSRGGSVLSSVVVRRIVGRLLDGTNASERVRSRSEVLLLSSHLLVPPQSSNHLLPLHARLPLVHLRHIHLKLWSSALFDRNRCSLHHRRLLPRFERIDAVVRPETIPRSLPSAQNSIPKIRKSLLEILQRSNQRQFRFRRRRRREEVRIRSTHKLVRSVTRMESGGEIRRWIEIIGGSLLRVEEVALLFGSECFLVRLSGLGHLGVERTPAGGGFVPGERLRLGHERRTNRLRSVECRRSRRRGSTECSLTCQGSIHAASTDCTTKRKKTQRRESEERGSLGAGSLASESLDRAAGAASCGR